MNKLEKPVKGKNIKHILDAFFNKYIRKHFNEVNSIDFIISDLGERMADGGRNIKILRNDNPIRTNNPDWFPPKPQQTDHICTFLKQLMDNELGTKDSYIGLKAEVVTENETYIWDVKAVDYYANSGTVILKTDPRQGITIECPAIVRLYIYPLLTSKAVSSIIYNSIVTSESKYSFILGERNIHKGEDNVWIFGKNNISGETNHNSLIDGYNNDVDSYGNLVIGDNNRHRSYYGATIGQKIKNFKKNNYLFGEGHDNTNGAQYGAVFGKYSKIEEDTAFAIGDGEDENNRHNLFEVKYGGPILDKDGNDIRNSGGQQVQSDWNENDNTKPAYIKNKPTIPAAQQPADWNATQGPTRILNKPTVPEERILYGLNSSKIKQGYFVFGNSYIWINSIYLKGIYFRYGWVEKIIYNSSNNRNEVYIKDAICYTHMETTVEIYDYYIKTDIIIYYDDIANRWWADINNVTNVCVLNNPRLDSDYAMNYTDDAFNVELTPYGYTVDSTSVYSNIIFKIFKYNRTFVIPTNLDNNHFNILSTLVFKLCTKINSHYGDADNIKFIKADDTTVWLLKNYIIEGRIYDIVQSDNDNIIFKIRYSGLVAITSGAKTTNILRKSYITVEQSIGLAKSNYKLVSEEFTNFEELQVFNNN